jgi:hypothetical protein
MKAAYLGVALAVTVGLTGCLEEQSDSGYVLSWASADSVEVLSAAMPAVQFRVLGAKPTPCHEVIAPVITEDQSGRRVNVRMRSRTGTDVVCIQVLGSHETTILVPVSAPGVWEFTFQDGPGTETVIEVDVSE